MSSFEVGFLPSFSGNFQHRLAIFPFTDQQVTVPQTSNSRKTYLSYFLVFHLFFLDETGTVNLSDKRQYRDKKYLRV